MFPLFQKTANSIHVNELDPLLNEVNLIDIREPHEFIRGSIQRAKNIPMRQLLNTPTQYLDKNETYYIMCQSGGRSLGAVSILQRAGYDVINVKGGFMGYSGKNKNRT